MFAAKASLVNSHTASLPISVDQDVLIPALLVGTDAADTYLCKQLTHHEQLQMRQSLQSLKGLLLLLLAGFHCVIVYSVLFVHL